MEAVAGGELVGASGGQSSDSISHEPQLPTTPPTGKLRKTAFRLFGGRKSICMLPNFFGGRGKGQGRGSSKTGVTKSQTYDGVSRGGWEESVRGGGDVTSTDFEFRNPNGSSNQRKMQEGLGKSQSLPRQRRGLRGLFSSIRRHRKTKNTELERSETLEMSSGETVPGSQSNVGHHSDDSDSRLGEVSEPDVPTVANSSHSAKLTFSSDECTKDETLVPVKEKSKGKVSEEEAKRGDERKGDEEQERARKGRLTTYRQPLTADSEMDRLAELNADLPEGKLPVLSASSDNVNLIFGDVSSLKSFDSLTGCGDIIADQDDVSVADSSASGERGSRNAGKRSSCLVTYQGGGEEMATPDEVDGEYLHSLWESDVGNEVCYLPSEQTDSLSVTPDQPIGSFQTATSSSGNTSTSPLGGTETALTLTDILTPQSDRQESVPNSDEGYYDSTTPGADEDSRERPRQERLPRDSYSGDALYELFEPDDQLLSPPLPSKDSHGFLGASLQGIKGKGDLLYALTSAALETGAMETEEERLSKIQHALLCCELQNLRSPSKDELLFCGECFYSDTSPQDGNCKSSPEEGLHQHGARPSQGSQVMNEALSNSGTPLQHKDGVYGRIGDSKFSPLVSKSPSPLQDAVLYPERERGDVSDRSSLPPTRGCSQSQEELMVCFSQALVDYTKNTRLYRNSTESLDGSESSSPFGPSLSALPAIVTFDVVDMENEGECEQQTELVEEEEELSSPYEPFEDDGCYLQQDAFAECDQRTFDAYEQSLLFSNAWGITSLPRHLSRGRPVPPVPAPLALNRRSRSLDTDSLELQTSELYASVVSHRANMSPSLQCRKNCPETGNSRDMRHPGRDLADRWHACEFDSSQKASVSFRQQQKFSHGSPRMETVCTSNCQQTLRPSHLPLQAACRNGSSARIPRAGAEGGEMGGEGNSVYPCSYPPSGMQWKSRPVGVTQGIPHRRSDRSEDPREITAKSRRAEMDGGLSTAAPKRTM